MEKRQIIAVLNDCGFEFCERSKDYYIPDFDNICANLNDKEDRGYYNGEYDDTCFLHICDKCNELEIPIEYIKGINISKNNKLKTIDVSIDTKIGTFIRILFESKRLSPDEIKDDLEYSKHQLYDCLFRIDALIEELDSRNKEEE